MRYRHTIFAGLFELSAIGFPTYFNFINLGPIRTDEGMPPPPVNNYQARENTIQVSRFYFIALY